MWNPNMWLFWITRLGLGDKIIYGEGFVICGAPAWLVSLALTMVLITNRRFTQVQT
jgi:hypothetical protein